MQMHRLFTVGRLALVMGVVAVAGCSEGEWDWFGLKKSEPKDKQVTKARRPATKEPAVAESKKKPETPAGDAKSREVDDKVERYVHSMNTQYDPNYQNNDFSSKISRQNDPNRAARVRQTAIRSRTDPTLDEAAAGATPPDEPSSEKPTPEGATSSASGDGGDSGQGRTTAKPREVDRQPTQVASSDSHGVPESNVEKETGKPTDDAKSAPPESAMKPPVLSEVTVTASPTSIDGKPMEDTPVEPPPAEPTPVERKPVEPARVESTPVEEKPIEPKPATKTPVEEKPVASPVIEPPPVKPTPKKIAPRVETSKPEQNATEASPNVPSRIEPPKIEEKPEEIRRPEPAPVEPATVKKVSETLAVKKRHAANTPSSPPQQPVDTFKKKLKEQEALVAKNPDDVEQQFNLRMMYLVDGQDDKALAPSSSMNAETQEILLGQLRTLMAARSSNSRDPAVWANKQLDAIEKLRGLLRAKADLVVPKVELCKSIVGFGLYEPIEPAAFKAGAKNRVLLYIEVDNFKCEKTKTGLFRTLLSVRKSLMNKSGEELWSTKDDNIEDLARQERRDFYLTIGPLAIPKSLGPGEYVFKVEVEDVLGGKINSNVVRFKMVP